MKFKFHDWELEEMDRYVLAQMKAIGWKFGCFPEKWEMLVRAATIDVDESKPKK